MSDPFSGQKGRSKAERLADAINRLLFNLLERCAGGPEGKAMDRFEIGVIGYGSQVGPAWSGSLAGQNLVWISEIEDKARVEERRQKVEDGAGGLAEKTTKFMTWFDPVAKNGTPMCQALRQARSLLELWVQAHPNSFPPVVFNITDGEATDGDPRQPAGALRELATQDGNLLLFNLHLSSRPGEAILYPEIEAALPDEFSRQLFQMSSLLPPPLQAEFKKEGYAIGPESRGFVFNTDIIEVIQCLVIGTRRLR